MDARAPEVLELAAGYVRASEALSRDDDPDGIWDPEVNPDYRAHDRIDDAIKGGPPELAWAYTLAVLRAAPDDRLGIYAAGPLEECVRRHGVDLVDAIEREAANDDRFRWALGGIWLSTGDLPDAVLRRVVRASGDVIKVLGWPPKEAPPDSPDSAP